MDTTNIPEELQCLYTQSLCCRERAIKEDGDRHNLCEYHRDKANAAQRRSAKKKRDENRRKRILQRAQEHAAKSGVSLRDLINSTQFHTEPILDECDLTLIDSLDGEEDLSFENMVFSEEDLKWLTEALVAPMNE